MEIIINRNEVSFQDFIKARHDLRADTAPTTSALVTRDALQLFIYSQISRLIHLETLNLRARFALSSRIDENLENLPQLELDLNHGLDRLATLSKLKILEFRQPQKMTEIELRWIGENWTKLEKISEAMNSDSTVNEDLKNICHKQLSVILTK
ncbi:hypothetical protein BGZ83_004155 [Gryganskiella cystojenkinii]|nr:hypothetical protein BGZ83_004155 [Gryganskiella cystojenkinii]